MSQQEISLIAQVYAGEEIVVDDEVLSRIAAVNFVCRQDGAPWALSIDEGKVVMHPDLRVIMDADPAITELINKLANTPNP